MAMTMYSGFVPVCLQLLGGLKTVLKKAEESKKLPPILAGGKP